MNQVIKNLMVALMVVAIALPIAAAPLAKVDINKATIGQLEALPRIGPAVARRVVEYREANGGFRKIEELMNVRGIGEKTFALLREQITVATADEKATSDAKVAKDVKADGAN